jgi:deoxyribose-phosphate aldolase
MLKEILIKDYCLTQKELEQKILDCASYTVDNVCIPYSMIAYCKDVLDLVNIVPVIDFPSGVLSTKDKSAQIISLDYLGYKTIDVCINHYFIKNNLIKDFLREIDTIRGLLEKRGKECRFIFDYCLLNSELVKDVTVLLKSRGVSKVVISTTEYADNPVDDRIFNSIISNCGLKCVIANRYLNKERLARLKEYQPYGIRCVSNSSFSEIVYN